MQLVVNGTILLLFKQPYSLIRKPRKNHQIQICQILFSESNFFQSDGTFFNPRPTKIPRTSQTCYFGSPTTETTCTYSDSSYNIYQRPAHYCDTQQHNPQILNLSIPKSTEAFQSHQYEILDLSKKSTSNPTEQQVISEDPLPPSEDTHHTGVQSPSPPSSPRSTPGTSPSPTETPYSPTMPYFNPNSNASEPEERKDGPTERGDWSSTGFPPKPIPLEQAKSRDRYSYLLHDPRTVFAGAPSTFLKDEASKYADRLRRRALQIGVKPENLSFCDDGHSLTRTEVVQKGDFIYKLTSTLTPLPKHTRLREQGSQTESEECPRCRPGCRGCGRVFICSKD